MIEVALSKHIEDLEIDVNQLGSENLRVQLQEYQSLRDQIESLLLRNNGVSPETI